MDTKVNQETAQQPLAAQLKEQSRTNHDSVDNLVMSVEPFKNLENYAKFLKLQSIFHKIVDPIYKDEKLNKQIPELEKMARYQLVLQDLKDSNQTPWEPENAPKTPEGAAAIGWLYCAEGSNLGAAFLYKDVQKLNQAEGKELTHAAAHLAPHDEGRKRHWAQFVEHLNALELTQEERQTAIKGAKQAFAQYKIWLCEIFNLPEKGEQIKELAELR